MVSQKKKKSFFERNGRKHRFVTQKQMIFKSTVMHAFSFVFLNQQIVKFGRNNHVILLPFSGTFGAGSGVTDFLAVASGDSVL